MPVNLYNDRKVSLRRPHGNSDLDIVRALYARCKANVTEALVGDKHHISHLSSVSSFPYSSPLDKSV